MNIHQMKSRTCGAQAAAQRAAAIASISPTQSSEYGIANPSDGVDTSISDSIMEDPPMETDCDNGAGFAGSADSAGTSPTPLVCSCLIDSNQIRNATP